MNRILKAMKLDFYAAKSALPLSLVGYAFGLFLGIVTKEPMATLVIVMLLNIFVGGNVFSVHEKSRSEKLYGILPLRKNEMVAGRYVYGLILGLVNIVGACILAYLVMLFMKVSYTSVLFWLFAAISFIYYCFATGFLYPIYFKFSFSKGYLFAMIPMALLGVGVMYFARRSGFMTGVNSVMQFFSDHVYLAPVFGLLIGLALLVISAFISRALCIRKEL